MANNVRVISNTFPDGSYTTAPDALALSYFVQSGSADINGVTINAMDSVNVVNFPVLQSPSRYPAISFTVNAASSVAVMEIR